MGSNEILPPQNCGRLFVQRMGRQTGESRLNRSFHMQIILSLLFFRLRLEFQKPAGRQRPLPRALRILSLQVKLPPVLGLLRRLGRARDETARHPARNAAESKQFEIGVVLGFEGAVGNEGPFADEVDGGRGHGPSLVIRSPLWRLARV